MSMRDNRHVSEGWAKKQLKDVCIKVEYGTAAKSQPQGKVPVLRMGNIQDGRIDWENLAYTSDQEEIDKYLLKYNDVLFNRTNSAEHVGKAAIYKGEMPAIFAGYLIRIHRKDELIDADFLNYYLNSDAVREYGRTVMSQSVNQANINGTKLKEYSIPVPPLTEQNRIVAILDEAFEGIDSAIANTERNLANARELFESYLNAIFTRKDDGWTEARLTSLTSKIGSGATPRGGKNSYKKEGIPLIRSLNVHDRKFKTKNLAFVDDDQAEKLSHVIVEEGDVLLNITGASIARSCIAPREYLPARVNQHVSIIRPDGNQISSRFLNYLLTSRPYKERLLSTGDKAGATRQALTKSQIQDFSVLFPALREQESLVTKLDLLGTETRRLEAIYQQKIAALNELKQSILKKAFSGELTTDTAAQASNIVQEVAAA